MNYSYDRRLAVTKPTAERLSPALKRKAIDLVRVLAKKSGQSWISRQGLRFEVQGSRVPEEAGHSLAGKLVAYVDVGQRTYRINDLEGSNPKVMSW